MIIKQKDLVMVKKSLLICLLSIIVGVLLMITAYCIPTKKININVKKSSDLYSKEDSLQSVNRWYGSGYLDNYTDSIMLLNAIYDGNESVLEKSLTVPARWGKIKVDETNELNLYPKSTLLANCGKKSISKTEINTDGKLSVVDYMVDSENVEFYKSTYARYWHGYLVILKPLLLLFNYSQIRIINLIFQIVVVLLGTILLFTVNKKASIPYIFLWLIWLPELTSKSLQYSSIFYITYIFSILLMILVKRKSPYVCYIFLITGISTAFFDFLTYPIVALGVLLLLYFILVEQESANGGIKNFFVFCFQWGMGYAVMWFGKWIVASVFTEENVIRDALKSVVIRTSKTDGINYFDILEVNCSEFLFNPIIFILVICSTCMIVHRIVKRKKWDIFRVVIFAIIALFPFIWYAFAKEHSYEHARFTGRNLAVLCISFVSIAFCTEKGEKHG